MGAVILSFVGACGIDQDAPLVTLRDSAGVEIVESTAPTWAAGDEWAVFSEPALEIGETGGADEYLLFRASCTLRLGDGRIVVVNGGTSEIRFYDSTGAFVRAVGGRGGGPGEFGSGPTIWRLGTDRLLAFDGMGQRVSILDTAGTFVRSFRLEWDSSFRYTSMLEVAGPLDDGSLLVLQIPNAPLSEAGWGRRVLPFLRYGPDGYLSDRVTTLDGDEYTVFGADLPRPDGETFHVGGGISFPFAREAVWTVHDAQLYYTSNDGFEIRVYDGAGTLVRIIRALGPLQPVTGEDLAAVEDALEDRRAALRERLGSGAALSIPGLTADPFGEAPVPTVKPPIAEIAVDAGGNVWVRRTGHRWRPPEDERREPQREWTVFSADGRMLGDITTPRRYRVEDIGDDYVLGVWWDELDVERVRMYRLVKP